MVEGSWNVHTKLPTRSRLAPRAICLQEARTPDPLSKSTTNLQINGMHHSVEAPNQWDLQHHQSSHRLDTQDQSNAIAHFLGQKNFVITTTANGIKLSTIGPSEGTWKNSSNRTFQKEYILTLGAVFWQPNTQPSREQHLITQYKAIDWLPKFWTYKAYFLPFLIIFTQILKKNIYSMLLTIVVHPSIHMLRWCDFPHTEAATRFLHYWDFSHLEDCVCTLCWWDFLTQRRQCKRAYGLFLSHPTGVETLCSHSKDCVCTLRWWYFPHSEGSIQTCL